MLVAVAHLGPEHFPRRWNAYGWLFFQKGIHVPRQSLGSGARAGGRWDIAQGVGRFGANLRRIALDQHLGRQVLRRRVVCRGRAQLACIAKFDNVALDRLSGPLQIGARQIGAFQSYSETPRGSSMPPAR